MRVSFNGTTNMYAIHHEYGMEPYRIISAYLERIRRDGHENELQ